MFKVSRDLITYVEQNYPEVTDKRIDGTQWDLYCPHCKIVRGFRVTTRISQLKRTYNHGQTQDTPDSNSPISYWFECPVCRGFKQWLLFEFSYKKESADPTLNSARITRYFRITSLPGEGMEDIDELPDDPPSLKAAYRQAIRAKDANAHIAAAAMFRRAVQVITREILGATPGSLANELKQCVGKTYNGGKVQQTFAEIGYIIKEVGNQAAHPDVDPDLLDFTPEDADDLQIIFMELVSELFVVPAAMKKAKAEFLQRRKIP
ncbi:MAG: DUF4145 domain-containing protein [Hyphomonadaceae bacterium]|nr:DUF4145 domain-containing protein [Hyphomonadaceae bacterium]